MDFLVAQVENLKDAAPAESLGLDSVILGEQFYFFTVVLMWLIHVGFMTYETGRRAAQERARDGDEEHPHDRRRHAELLLLRLVDLQLQHAGLCRSARTARDFTAVACQGGIPWSDAFGPNLTNNINLVFFLAFLLFSLDDGVDHVRARCSSGCGSRPTWSSRCCSARPSGSSTPPGAGASAAG